jgi:NitT/TauT family transport system substrate-binding protein
MKKMALTLAMLAFMVGCTACAGKNGNEQENGQTTVDVNVYMPDGAPALGLAHMLAADTNEDGVNYRVVDAKLIASKVTNQDEAKNADLCVMPLTAASKLLGSGEAYTMLGTVTNGNLYLLAKEGEYTADNLSTLVGKKVGVLQINEVPGLTLKAVLNEYEIPWQELTNDATMDAAKVNLVALESAAAVGTVEADCYMIAEPAASVQVKKNGLVIAGSLQTLYSGDEGYPQAVLVAKNQLLLERAEWVQEFVSQVADAPEWLATASAETIVAAVNAHMDDPAKETSLKAPMLSSDVIARCGIAFHYAAQVKSATNSLLEDLIAVNHKAAAMPSDGFFWTYQK